MDSCFWLSNKTTKMLKIASTCFCSIEHHVNIAKQIHIFTEDSVIFIDFLRTFRWSKMSTPSLKSSSSHILHTLHKSTPVASAAQKFLHSASHLIQQKHLVGNVLFLYYKFNCILLLNKSQWLELRINYFLI